MKPSDEGLKESLAIFKKFCQEHGRPGMFERRKDGYIRHYWKRNDDTETEQVFDDGIHNPMTGEIRGGYADFQAMHAWNED